MVGHSHLDRTFKKNQSGYSNQFYQSSSVERGAICVEEGSRLTNFLFYKIEGPPKKRIISLKNADIYRLFRLSKLWRVQWGLIYCKAPELVMREQRSWTFRSICGSSTFETGNCRFCDVDASAFHLKILCLAHTRTESSDLFSRRNDPIFFQIIC